jgi:hypothetical protein
MPHDFLSGSRCDSSPIQHHTQCHSHGVNIDSPFTFVCLWNASGLQATIQSPKQTGRHGEQLQIDELAF